MVTQTGRAGETICVSGYVNFVDAASIVTVERAPWRRGSWQFVGELSG